jgi:hypothetical protein
MCWFSIVGGAINKGISHVAKACGLPEEERKSLESFLNVTVGGAGALLDPVGGGILITRGVLQAVGASKETTESVNGVGRLVDTHFHDKAMDKAVEILDHWADVGGF